MEKDIIKPSVSVLMSTYNGEKYLRQQIASIIHQRDVNVKLLVRDDGSLDDTKKILDEYAGIGQLSWYQGENIKPARSFLKLLQDSPESDFYAFSDQDDVWLENKLSAATTAIGSIDRPAFYFCPTTLVDKNLKPIFTPTINPHLTFGESLVYLYVSGCTIVINKQLRDIINSYKPQCNTMHDVWIYCVAQAVGAYIYFDKTSHILYRQHETNTIGLGHSEVYEWKQRIKRVIIRKEHIRSNRAKDILHGFGTMLNKQNLDILSLFVLGKKDLRKRLKLLFDNRYNCENKKTLFFFKLAVLLNTY